MKMKHIIALTVCLSLVLLLFSGCICFHKWREPDCENPKTCEKCGKTDGEPLGHTWQDADCVTPKTCSVCGKADGDPLGHTWQEGDCFTPKTCSVCGETEGEPLGHDPAYACVKDATCSRCGTLIPAAGHLWSTKNEVVEPTCTEEGTETRVCNICGSTDIVNKTHALGHEYELSICIRCGAEDPTPWKTIYPTVLSQIPQKWTGSLLYSSYTLYDMNADGKPELFVHVGHMEADAVYEVYTYASGQAIYAGSMGGSYGGLGGWNSGGGVMTDHPHMGYTSFVLTTLTQGNKLSSSPYHDFEEYTYYPPSLSSFSYLKQWDLSNPSGLEWNGNPQNSNEYVLSKAIAEVKAFEAEPIAICPLCGGEYRQSQMVLLKYNDGYGWEQKYYCSECVRETAYHTLTPDSPYCRLCGKQIPEIEYDMYAGLCYDCYCR